MTKFFFAIAIPVVLAVTWLILPENTPTQAIDDSSMSVSNSAAMSVVVDPVSGALRAPTRLERQAISKQRQSVMRDKSKIQYRNTMTLYADGTRTGVVDPVHTHRIYATLDQNGSIVVHEDLAPPAAAETGALK